MCRASTAPLTQQRDVDMPRHPPTTFLNTPTLQQQSSTGMQAADADPPGRALSATSWPAARELELTQPTLPMDALPFEPDATVAQLHASLAELARKVGAEVRN